MFEEIILFWRICQFDRYRNSLFARVNMNNLLRCTEVMVAHTDAGAAPPKLLYHLCTNAEMIRPAFAVAVTVLYQGCSFLNFISYTHTNLTNESLSEKFPAQ